jgi:hypothetical protein
MQENINTTELYDDLKIVMVTRTSPASMEYYVQIIPVFGARPMYHFEKKSDALFHANGLKASFKEFWVKATEEQRIKALELIEDFTYDTEEDYKHLIDNRKTDIFHTYI